MCMNQASMSTSLITKVPLKTDYLTLYIEADQGMVFHHIQQSLYQLSALSISLLLAIDAGMSEQAAKTQVAELSGNSIDAINEYYHVVAALFSQQHTSLNYLDGRYPELLAKQASKKKRLVVKCPTYQIADCSFALNIASENLFKAITQILAPSQKSFTDVDFEITISQKNDVFSIYVNDLLVDQGLLFIQVLPEIIDRLQILAFQSSNYAFCFHGAALRGKYGKLLLPGKSGAGKSTLSAVLASLDYELYSDEMMVLNNNFSLESLNLPIAIKKGSWLALQDNYPELKTASIWQRIDGRQLKYVWPQGFAKKSAEKKLDEMDKPKTEDQLSTESFLLVNPNFSKINKKNTSPLTVIDSIVVLTQSGYQLGFELTEDKLDNLIGFLEGIARHQLFYSDTKEALSALNSLWQQ